jgi:prefoldin subunit 5
MEFFANLMPGKRAANQDNIMNSQSELGKGSADSAGTAQLRRTRSTQTRAASNVNTTDTSHSATLGYCDEDKDHTSRQTEPSQASQREGRVSKQRESARISGGPEKVQGQDSLSAGPPRRPGRHRQAPSVPDTSSSLQRGQGSSDAQERSLHDLDQLYGKIDQLSADLRGLQRTVEALEQEKHEVRQIHRALAELKQDRLDMRMVQHTLEGLQQGMLDMDSFHHSLQKLEQDNRQRFALQKDVKEARDQLHKTTLDLENTRKSWKKAVSQLDQIRSYGSGSFQVTDDELVSSVNGLRYDIRTFSMQYFMSETPLASVRLPVGGFSEYLRQTTAKSDEHLAYLLCNTFGPVFIQAFLWRLLIGEIFGRFRWMPRLGDSMAALYQALDPGRYLFLGRFQVWQLLIV